MLRSHSLSTTLFSGRARHPSLPSCVPVCCLRDVAVGSHGVTRACVRIVCTRIALLFHVRRSRMCEYARARNACARCLPCTYTHTRICSIRVRARLRAAGMCSSFSSNTILYQINTGPSAFGYNKLNTMLMLVVGCWPCVWFVFARVDRG